MKSRIFALALALLGFGTTSSNATTLGITDYSASAQHAYWDTFPSAVLTNQAPTVGVGFTGMSLSQSQNAGFPFGPQAITDGPAGDYFYDFTDATNWDLDFTSSSSVTTLVLQIKCNPPASGPLSTYFTPLLTVGSTSFTIDGAPTIGSPTGESVFGQNMVVATYTWTNINVAALSTFNISMTRAEGVHVAIDTFQIAAVPEPSTYALLGLGLGLVTFVVVRRRRAQTQSK